MIRYPDPLDAETFVSEAIAALAPVGVRTTTQWDLQVFDPGHLPVVIAICYPSVVGVEGEAETVAFDLDTIATTRKEAADLAAYYMRAFEVARRDQRVFPSGWISAVRIVARPVRADSGGNVNRVDGRVLGDPKQTSRYTARIALTVRPA